MGGGPLSSRDPRLKGKALEDLVEEWGRLRGFVTYRNIRVRGLSGALHEIDVLLDTSEGPIVVEVKNLNKKVDKEVVMKAANVAEDIGARGAIVVSAKGFTRDAERVARALRVELLSLDTILEHVEIASMPGDALYLEARLSPEEAVGYASKKLAKRRLLFLREEEPRLEECILHPLYYTSMRLRMGGSRFRDLNVAASAVYGLPLVLSGGVARIAGREVSHFPPEALRLYKEIAGETVSKAEVEGRIGAAGWRRIYNLLKSAGLIDTVSKRPLVVRVKNVLPRLEEYEGFSDLLIAPTSRNPNRGCRREEPRVSPGSVSSFLEALLDGRVIKHTFIYMPIYRLRMNARDGTYRIIMLSAWLREPIQLIMPLD